MLGAIAVDDQLTFEYSNSSPSVCLLSFPLHSVNVGSYEASDEFKEKQKKLEEEAANIALSAGSQISEADVAAEQAAGQASASERVRKWWVAAVLLATDGNTCQRNL